MKTRIVEFLGHGELLLPQLVESGLAANDRAKVRFALIQAAAAHAHNPAQAPADFSSECRRVGIEPAVAQVLVHDAQIAPGHSLAAPGLGRLIDDVYGDVCAMIAPLVATEDAFGAIAEQRLGTIAGRIVATHDTLRETDISGLIDVGGETASLHRLVMDLHKKLNGLASDCADQDVAGARVRGLQPEDRLVVEAFMKGLASTRELKFDHPGLDTTAARSGDCVVIQNDIGTTDAHVILVSVRDLFVEVRYTDVHRARAEFFVRLFDRFSADWTGLNERTLEGLAKNNSFFMVGGTFKAASRGARDEFLAEVGASLVFLIDWNKARKRLQALVRNNEAVAILLWAARHRHGHRAFLELGGNDLVTAAARHAAPSRIGFGERLDSVLGREGATDFLQSTLRICTDALRAGRSVRMVRDALEADLISRLGRTESTLLAVVVRQAGLAREIATRLAEHIADVQTGRACDGEKLARRAKFIEEKADRIAVDTRNAIAALEASPTITKLVNALEDAIDDLEQAAFMALYLPMQLDAPDWRPLEDLCAAAVSGAEAIASGVEAASLVGEGKRLDSDDALNTVSRLMDIEHFADAAERTATAFVLQRAENVRSALAVLEFARALERATDRLSSVGHHLYEHVMSDLKA